MRAAPRWREIGHRYYDALLLVVPPLTFGWLSLWYVFIAILRLRRILEGAASPLLVASLLGTVSIAAYTILLTWLMIIRHRPVAKSHGWQPRFAALAGTFLPLALVLLPHRPHLSIWFNFASSVLVAAGGLGMIGILRQLNRSFSIMPEARRLVTRGVYARLRHPLYLAEAVATLGALIQFWSLAALTIVLLQIACQLWRMDCEERVLRRIFPEYDAYSRVTPRLIPGLY